MKALVGTASAHHRQGSHSATKAFTISAPAKTLTWADPHTHITLKHRGDIWEGTRAPLYHMQGRSVSQEMLKSGTTVTVEGCPSPQKQREMRAEQIIVAGRSVERR